MNIFADALKYSYDRDEPQKKKNQSYRYVNV